MASAPAHAQATRTWVSGVGDDVNPCSRTAPCKTFAGAISKTQTGGYINCIDSAGYGAVTITKNMTIDCSPFLGGVLAGGVNGVNVNGAGITVVLRGLDIEGGPSTAPSSIGVNIVAAGAVHIQKSFIYGFQAGTAAGVRIATTTGNPKVYITDSYIHDNGVGATGGGVISGGTGGTPFVALYNVRLDNNVFGVANNPNSRMRIANSLIAGNVTGIEVDVGGVVSFGNTDLNFNGTAITGATTSFGNNRLAGNTSDGTAPTAAGAPSSDLGQK
jgi:hypothetical protein